MIEEILYFGNIIFFVFLCRVVLQIMLNAIQLRFKKDGNPTDDEYHRLYEESVEWMRNERQEPHRR